jgi:hypothetical protein
LLGWGASVSPPPQPKTTVVVYDDFEKPGGYTMADYSQKWSNKFGPGEMAVRDTRTFHDGVFSVDATPFRTGYDFSLFDHIKYFAASTATFPVPKRGSVQFSADIKAETAGTAPGHVVHGSYGPPYSYPAGQPYEAAVFEGQQASASLHMLDFRTGQLFDWFVTRDTALTLVERVPSLLTDPTIPPTDRRYVGRDKIYTQFVRQVPLSPGWHNYAIRFSRNETTSFAEHLLDGRVVSRVDRVGIPLDVQGVPYTGVYPSLGRGEELADRIDSVTIGHGLFSCLDAFPFQHPEAPERSVSIPLSERLFGQGAQGAFDNFVVTTVE